ncbi:MAG: hypothetical protein ACR2LS_00920 [Thermomicrobiales bacterium]
MEHSETLRSESALEQPVPATPAHHRLPSCQRFAWFMIVSVTALLVAFLQVPAYDYDRDGLELSTMTTLELWRTQLQGLPDVAYDGLLTTLFAGLIGLFSLGCGALVWYSLYPSTDLHDDDAPVDAPVDS